MAKHCQSCGGRLRTDGTCSTPSCVSFRKGRRGAHWQQMRLQDHIGDRALLVGAFVAGGGILALRLRHDIRVAIACGMFLRSSVPDRALRLEILTVCYLCYWRWSTRRVLIGMTSRLAEISAADGAGRASIISSIWAEMATEMHDFQVSSDRSLWRVELVERTRTWQKKAPDTFRYHTHMNPSSRRTGTQELEVLLADLRSGALTRSCSALAESFASETASYSGCSDLLKKAGVQFWRDATYTRTRCGAWKQEDEEEVEDGEEVLVGFWGEESQRRRKKRRKMMRKTQGMRCCKSVAAQGIYGGSSRRRT